MLRAPGLYTAAQCRMLGVRLREETNEHRTTTVRRRPPRRGGVDGDGRRPTGGDRSRHAGGGRRCDSGLRHDPDPANDRLLDEPNGQDDCGQDDRRLDDRGQDGLVHRGRALSAVDEAAGDEEHHRADP